MLAHFIIPKIKMVKKQISDFEKGKIIAWNSSNIGVREISRRISRSPQTISNFLIKYKDTGNKNRQNGSGRKRKTTPRED